MDDTQQRFLRAIAEHIAPERVVEVHLFAAMRQGPNESCVAVIAAEPEAAAVADAPPAAHDDAMAHAPPESPDDAEADAPLDAAGDAALDAPDESYPETHEPLASADDAPPAADAEAPVAPRRLTIYRAQYRLVLKGADRGTWDVGVAAEADAPIETVDEVVRGVRRRAGEDAEPERLTGDAFRAVVASDSWTATQ